MGGTLHERVSAGGTRADSVPPGTVSQLIVPFTNEPSQALATALNTLAPDRANLERIWIFDEAQRPDTEPAPPDVFFESASGLHFVTAFSPGRLMLFESANGHYRPAKRKNILELDSNLCSILRLVFVDGSMNAEYFGIVVDLAKHRRIWRAEMDPRPYLQEVALRRDVADSRDDAEKVFCAILKFQTLRPETSEGEGRLCYDDSVLDHIYSRFGARTLEECAAIHVQQIIANGEPGLDHDHIATYGALLKMIDVGIRMKRRPIAEKLAEIDSFIVNEMDAVQPRLFVLSRLFFQGALSRLLKISPGDSNFDRKHLIGSSFDLYLATLHEKLLGNGEPPEGWMAVLCTRDKGLASYAGRYLARSVATMKDHTYRIAHAWDDQWIESALGRERHAEVIASINSRIPDVKKTALSFDTIGAIRDLEQSLVIGPDLSLLGEASPETIKKWKRPW
jgi:hypothetical protein